MKKTLMGTVLLMVASGIVYARANRRPQFPKVVSPLEEKAPVVPSGWAPNGMSTTDVATRRFMMYFMLPL